jgi:hypothetical protein
MLNLFVVSFGFWFQPFFLSQFVFSANRRLPGLIKLPFSETSVAAVKDLIVFPQFNFIDIVLAHNPPSSFLSAPFLDNFNRDRHGGSNPVVNPS